MEVMDEMENINLDIVYKKEEEEEDVDINYIVNSNNNNDNNNINDNENDINNDNNNDNDISTFSIDNENEELEINNNYQRVDNYQFLVGYCKELELLMSMDPYEFMTDNESNNQIPIILENDIPIPPPPPPLYIFGTQRLIINNQNNNNIGGVGGKGGMIKGLSDTIECPICMDDVSTVYRFDCGHQYCVNCTKQHLHEQVWRHKGKLLGCPFPKCKTILQYDRNQLDNLKQIMDIAILKKYELFRSIIDKAVKAQSIIFCMGCMTPLSQTDDRSSPIVVCDNPECGQSICFDCVTFIHPDVTCEENRRTIELSLTEDDKKTLKLMEDQQMKYCPRCGVLTIKDDGCEYVCCGVCGHEFCYYCLEPHDHNTSTHIHGPKYKAMNPYIHNAYVRRQRHRVLKRVGYYTLLSVGAVILVPPAIVIGAIPYGIHIGIKKYRKWSAKRAIIKKSNTKSSFNQWVVNEKKRREDLGLPVSQYIIDLEKNLHPSNINIFFL